MSRTCNLPDEDGQGQSGLVHFSLTIYYSEKYYEKYYGKHLKVLDDLYTSSDALKDLLSDHDEAFEMLGVKLSGNMSLTEQVKVAKAIVAIQRPRS